MDDLVRKLEWWLSECLRSVPRILEVDDLADLVFDFKELCSLYQAHGTLLARNGLVIASTVELAGFKLLCRHAYQPVIT